MTTLTTVQVTALTSFATAKTEALFKSGNLFTRNSLVDSKAPLQKK